MKRGDWGFEDLFIHKNELPVLCRVSNLHCAQQYPLTATLSVWWWNPGIELLSIAPDKLARLHFGGIFYQRKQKSFLYQWTLSMLMTCQFKPLLMSRYSAHDLVWWFYEWYMLIIVVLTTGKHLKRPVMCVQRLMKLSGISLWTGHCLCSRPVQFRILNASTYALENNFHVMKNVSSCWKTAGSRYVKFFANKARMWNIKTIQY